MFERIRKIVCEHLGVEEDKVNESTEFILDLGCDSLELIELMIAVENEFGISERDISKQTFSNPFGKITSAHLLKPMFDIAEHFNVQLICLSDINKSDVVSCFECVIKLSVKAQKLSNYEILTHEGNERIEHGYYKIMNGQMSLF